MDDTLGLAKSVLSYPYGTITLSGAPSQETSGFQETDQRRPKHHISLAFRRGIQFALCCFHSLLLTASLLISFPAGTKMFQFPAFPLMTEHPRRD